MVLPERIGFKPSAIERQALAVSSSLGFQVLHRYIDGDDNQGGELARKYFTLTRTYHGLSEHLLPKSKDQLSTTLRELEAIICHDLPTGLISLQRSLILPKHTTHSPSAYLSDFHTSSEILGVDETKGSPQPLSESFNKLTEIGFSLTHFGFYEHSKYFITAGQTMQKILDTIRRDNILPEFN